VSARQGSGAAPHKPAVGVTFVVAVADNDVIGQGGGLPWRLKSDMQHFRAATMGKPVVMGRKTYLSIGRPLAGRTNIVVSRDRAFTAPGVLVAPSIEAALTVARGDALRRGASGRRWNGPSIAPDRTTRPISPSSSTNDVRRTRLVVGVNRDSSPCVAAPHARNRVVTG
jgi:hypothetical protein